MENQEPTREQIEKAFLDVYIDTFSQTFKNVVDSALDEALNIQRDNFSKNSLRFKELTKIIISDSKDGNENELDKYYNRIEQGETLEVAYALYELKIIYAYKYFEIKLKELYTTAFQETLNKELYDWDEFKEYYKRKNILLSKNSSYNSIYQLKEVNNNLKHSSGIVDYKIDNINEFKGTSKLQVGHLKAFYERVKDAPKSFITELSVAVYDELFKDRKSTNVESRFDIPEGGLTYGD